MEPVRIIEAGNTLGECPVWDARTQSLWWTDIQERRLFRHAQDGTVTRFATPERLCSFGLTQDDGVLIAAFESGIALYEPEKQSVTWLARPPLPAGVRFNDGRVDRQGRFWSGTMAEGDGAAPLGTLYCLDRARALTEHESGIAISNSLCWSPDGTRLYFADSPRRTIFVYDFDTRAGTLSNRRIFAATPEGAYPDGANVDAEGYLWSAQWGASRVVRYAPDGAIDSVIDLPTEQPSCIAFGGPDLDLLFVTTARDGLAPDTIARQPHCGDVFVYKVASKGLPDGRFV
jgi:sugar lactone lactonase YvrE